MHMLPGYIIYYVSKWLLSLQRVSYQNYLGVKMLAPILTYTKMHILCICDNRLYLNNEDIKERRAKVR